MACCHADFALTDASDKAFTVGMSTFTFGHGCLGEAGDQARELGLRRVALFTDAALRDSAHVATVSSSLAAAGVDVVIYDAVVVEPTTASFKAAAKFATEGGFDGYVSVGGGSVMDTCKAANLYATYPAEFMTYVNAPIGAGQKVPGPVKPHIACPTTAGTGSETTGIAIFNLTEINAKTGIISRRLIPTVALIDPDVTRTLGKNVMAASGFDCMSHALESLTARAWPRRQNPARGASRPVSQGANPFSDALASEALKAVGKFLVRAVNDASDVEARTEMMYAATQAGIAFNAAGCHLPHGLSYAVSGLARDFHVPGYPEGKTLVPHGMAVVLNNPSVWRYTAPCAPERHIRAAAFLGGETRGAMLEDAGEALAGRVIELMRAAGMPNGLAELGFGSEDIDALANGAEPQYRVIRNAPKEVSRDDLKSLFGSAMRYW
ncbi:MAG: iron-containing alcohol dehydrogenase [Betaproteobacteria bacterium]|nr:MAG: iron-containing alcohol dehydrogenase [Betaproteobacteria bacterium]